MRLTKIICTLGPSSSTPEQIAALAEEGMVIARINCSHGSAEDHRMIVRRVCELRTKRNLPIAIMLDTLGCEIRTGDVEKPIEIALGQEVSFSPLHHRDDPDGRTVITVNYDQFTKDVRTANTILLDNGDMSFSIVEIRKDGTVIARSNDTGSIGSRRHVNLPGGTISLPSMTENDWKDLAMGIEEGVDMIGLSFIRKASEVEEVKQRIAEGKSAMLVIAKIETQQAIDHLDSIIDAADGIMVARGDLGAELPFERIPAIQDTLVTRCIDKGKPVIIATHMLESMIKLPRPTRAEVTDIAHAATTRADVTMLSAETASGKYPVAAVHAMATILKETEAAQPPEEKRSKRGSYDQQSAIASAAISMALTVHAPAIVVLTRTGWTARAVSQQRSNIPILALTESDTVARQLQLWHGIIPRRVDFTDDPEQNVQRALTFVRDAAFVKSGERVVVIADVQGQTGRVHSVQFRTIP